MAKTKLFIILFIGILMTGCAGLDYPDIAMDTRGSVTSYTQNTSPEAADELLGIDAPAGSWSVNRFPVEDILGLTQLDGLADVTGTGTAGYLLQDDGDGTFSFVVDSSVSELDGLSDVTGTGTSGYVLQDDGDGTFSFVENSGTSYDQDLNTTDDVDFNEVDVAGALTAGSITTDAHADPKYQGVDADCTDGDVGFEMSYPATDTGSGSEDYDWTVETQVAGELVTVFSSDADGVADTTPLTQSYIEKTVPLTDGFDTVLTTGDGKYYIPIGKKAGGLDLVYLQADFVTAGTGTGTEDFDIQVHNVTQAADILSTLLHVDEDELSSTTAATPYVINTSNDSVTVGDLLRVDVDGVTSGADGAGPLLTIGFGWRTAAAGGGGVVDNCPDATYDLAYTGDNTNGTDYACFDDGTSSAQGTQNGTPTLSTSYVVINAVNENLTFDISGLTADLDAKGTLFFNVHSVTDISNDYVIMGVKYDASNAIWLRFENSGPNIYAVYYGNGVSQIVGNGGDTFSSDTDYRCGYTWDRATGVHAIDCVSSGSVSWGTPDDEDTEALTAWDDSGAVDPSAVYLGEDVPNGDANSNGLRVSDTYIVHGVYKASDPGSL